MSLTEKSNPNNKNAGSCDSSEEEDQDEPSFSTKNENIEYVLANFREKWQKELQNSPKHQNIKTTVKKDITQEEYEAGNLEQKARVLFLKGIEMERAGKLYEAIQFYRRAVQLVPDIEFRIHDISKNKKSKEQPPTINVIDDYKDANNSDDDAGDDKIKADLLLRIQKKCNKNQCICMPEFEQKSTHISVLPTEIILYIFRWIVSSDLDLRSLETCSRVCRGFYLCARDSEIWRSACSRAWGVNCGNLPIMYNSWRQMFLERSRLQFNGCYISKTTYIRHGENSFQDQFYRPWHLVAYYRYLRFFPEGLVLMLTSSDEPALCVGQLKHRNSKSPSILSGHYRLKDDRVTLVVQRQENIKQPQVFKRNRRKDVLDAEQTFHMELQIQSHNKRKHAQLVWTGYSVFTRTKKGDESTCTFDLVTNRFPPLWFSRVKSYTAESENPLQ